MPPTTTPAGSATVSEVCEEAKKETSQSSADRDVGQVIEKVFPEKDAPCKTEADSQQKKAGSGIGRSSTARDCSQVVELSAEDSDCSGKAECRAPADHDADVAVLLERLHVGDGDSGDEESGGSGSTLPEGTFTSRGPQHGRPVISAGGYYSMAESAPEYLTRTVLRRDDCLLFPASTPQTKRSLPVESDATAFYSQPNFATKYRHDPTEDDDGTGGDGDRFPSDDLGYLLRALPRQTQQRTRYGSETTASESSWDPADSPGSVSAALSPASSAQNSASLMARLQNGSAATQSYQYLDDSGSIGSCQSWPPSPGQQHQQAAAASSCFYDSENLPAVTHIRGNAPVSLVFNGNNGLLCDGLTGSLHPVSSPEACDVPAYSPPSFPISNACSFYGDVSGAFDEKPQIQSEVEDPFNEEFKLIMEVLQEDCRQTTFMRDNKQLIESKQASGVTNNSDMSGRLRLQSMQPAQPPMQPAQPPMQPAQPPMQPAQPPMQPAQPPMQPAQLPMQRTQSSAQAAIPPTQPAQPLMQPLPLTAMNLTSAIVPTTVTAVTCEGPMQQSVIIIALPPCVPPVPTKSPPAAPPTRPKERTILPRNTDNGVPSNVRPTTSSIPPGGKAKHTAEEAPLRTAAPKPQDRLLAARRTVAAVPDNDLRHQDNDGNTYLHVVVLKRDAYLVRAILERLFRSESLRGMVNLTNKAGQTSVYLATTRNHKMIVELLVQCHADVNIHAQSPEFQAPLHYAARYGERTLEVLQCLTKARFVDLNIRSGNGGRTALHLAVLSHGTADTEAAGIVNAIPTVRCLLAAGARLDLQDELTGQTPLHSAVARGGYELVREMVAAASTAYVDSALQAVTRQGDTCLHAAAALRPVTMSAAMDRIAILQLLVERGARTAALNCRRLRAAHLLLPMEDLSVRKLLE